MKLQQDAKPEDQLIYSIVGWHALTLPQDPRELLKARQDMFAVLLAVGLDPKRSIIFHQDQVCLALKNHEYSTDFCLESRPHRISLASELSDTIRQATTHDDLESRCCIIVQFSLAKIFKTE